MTLSRKHLYQIIFVICLLFVVARFVQAPAFSSSLLGLGFMVLPWVCFAISLYLTHQMRKVLKSQIIIEAKLDSLLQRSLIHPSPLSSVQHLARP